MARKSRQSSRFWSLVERQSGVVTRSQLRSLGYSDDAIDHRLEARRLHRIHQGVFAVGRPDLTDHGRWTAAVLACGKGAVLSHETAAMALGITPVGPAIHVSVPLERNPAHAGIAVHRRRSVPRCIRVRGLRVTRPLDTLIDAGVQWSDKKLELAVNEADKLGLLRADRARAQIQEQAGRPGVAKLRAVLHAHAPTDSDLERRFLRLLRRAGVPAPKTRARVLGFRVDFWWPELRLVVETDGLTYHRTPGQQAKDRKRDQALTAAGITCVRFTNEQIRRNEREVAKVLRAVVNRLSA